MRRPARYITDSCVFFALSLHLASAAPPTDPETGTGESPTIGTLENPTLGATAGLAPALPENVRPVGTTTQLNLAVGVGETDNVSLAPSNTESQTVATAGIDFALQQQDRHIAGDLTGNFNYLDYLEHAYNRQLFGRLDGMATATLMPDRFQWVLQDSFGQAQLDPFTPATPINLENINVFETGPDWLMHFGRADFVRAEARYAMMTYETSPLDSKRLEGDLAFGHQLAVNSVVTLNGEFERLLYDRTDLYADYDRRRFYVGYQGSGARTEIFANLGLAQAQEGARWISTPFAQFDVTRNVTADSKLTLTFGRQFTDAAEGFQSLRPGAIGGIVIAPVAGTLANYVSNYATGAWRVTYARTTIAATARWERDSYTESQYSYLNVERGDFELSLERRVTPIFTAQVFSSLGKTHYFDADYDSNDWTVGAAVLAHVGRRTELRLRFDRLSRTVTGVGLGYDEDRVFFTAAYRAL